MQQNGRLSQSNPGLCQREPFISQRCRFFAPIETLREKILIITRRSLFASTAVAAISYAFDSQSIPAFLCINNADWMDIPFEGDQLHIVGATKDGFGILPNMDVALIAEVRRVLGISLSTEDMRNVNMIDGGCGYYWAYLWTYPAWRKFRLWIYPICYPVGHDVTHAALNVSINKEPAAIRRRA